MAQEDSHMERLGRGHGVWTNVVAGLIGALILWALSGAWGVLSQTAQKITVCAPEADQVVFDGEAALSMGDLDRAARGAKEALTIEATCKAAHWLYARTLQRMAFEADRRGDMSLGKDLKQMCFAELASARAPIGKPTAQFRSIERLCRL